MAGFFSKEKETSPLVIPTETAAVAEPTAVENFYQQRMLKNVGLAREMFAEFIGTGLLVFFGCGAATALNSGDGIFPVSFTFGMVVFVMAMGVGDISGGHFNSAVSTALALTNVLPLYKLPFYILAQLLGAMFFGGLLRGIAPDLRYNSGISLSGTLTPGQGFMWELMGTLVIVLTVLLVAVRQIDGPKYFHPGFAIGMAVTFGITVAGPLTGGGLNQARTLGAVIWQAGFWDTNAGKSFWIYMLGPLFASCIAPLIAVCLYGDKSGLTKPSMETFKLPK